MRDLSINVPISKPFDIAFNRRGQAFVTGNGSNGVAVLSPNGRAALPRAITGGGLSKPLGIAADIEGNMWVANSDFTDVPCPTGTPPPPAQRFTDADLPESELVPIRGGVTGGPPRPL